MKKYKVIGKENCGWTPVRMLDGTGDTYLRQSDGSVMPFRFNVACEFHHDMAVVELKQNLKYSYIRSDEVFMPFEFDLALPFDEKGGIAYIGDNEFTVTKDGHCFRFKRDYFSCLKKGISDKYGPKIRFSNGKEFEFTFDIAGKIEEGMIPVKMKDGSGYTFVRQKDWRMMKGRYKQVAPFNCGLAMVMSFKNEIFFIDKDEMCYPKEEVDEWIKDQVDRMMEGYEREKYDEYDDQDEEDDLNIE